MVKKALATKKATSGAATAAAAKTKRAALADVGNVMKADATMDKKKTISAKTALGPKSNNGVTKPTRTNSTRPLGSKDAALKKSADLKRTSSQVNPVERATKKRATEPEQVPKEDSDTEELAEENVKPAIVTVTETTVTTKIEVQEPLVEAVEEPRVPDLDLEDLQDPLMVAEYAAEIFEYLHELELSTMANPDYMTHQDHVDWSDRDILNDWLVQVHQRFQLLPETFYLAINIIDRFLSTKIVQLDKLQLVGITALFIASKYEEVISPHITNFSYMAKDYPDSEILAAERFVLQALNYNLSYPNPLNFLRRISKADNYDIQTRTLGKYLLEISMMDHRFLDFPPSQCAAAAMYMSRMILNRGEWVCILFDYVSQQLTRTQDATLAHYSGYSEDELMPLFELLLDYCSGDIRHEAFDTKYASKKFLKGMHFSLVTIFYTYTVIASLVIRQWSERYLIKCRKMAALASAK